MKNATTQLVFINPLSKYVVNNIVEEDGAFYLTASAEETKEWEVGKYSYQLMDEESIYEHGDLIVLINFALQDTTTYLSKWENAIRQIDDILAGRASSASKTISVGDKSISYSSIDELLRLRDYFAQRLAEEQEELGEESYAKTNEHKIKFMWRGV